MDSVFDKKNNCCGCTACASICPVKAITMVEDECGFEYPEIDQHKCIDCGLCRKICAFPGVNDFPCYKKCYVAKHNLDCVVNESRSGGFFTGLSDLILAQKGVVYGALLDEDIFVRHVRATDASERDALRKSKYVQSNLNGVFQLVANDLKLGKMVLFSGTACQCNGLASYIKNKRISNEKLILCDLVCHSNASPGLFKKYITYQGDRFHSKVKEFYFRDKTKYRWIDHVEKIVLENGKVFYTDEYTNLFYTDDIRPSCFNCKYTSLHRATDFTIADCWGGEQVYPELVNEKGASLVFVNSDKADRLLGLIKKDMTIKEIDIKYVMQPRLKEHETMSMTYNQFWDDYQKLEFDKFMQKYGHNNYSISSRLRKKIVSVIKLPLRVIKRMMRILGR